MLDIRIASTTTPSSTTSSSPTSPTTGYFSYAPSTSSHYSLETPLESPGTVPTEQFSDPSNPLLAYRPAPVERRTSMDVSKVLQLQTAAAYHPARSNSNSSATSNASSTSTSPPTHPIRCSRCHQESIFGSSRGMVSFGTNLYYCKRCADIVGYGG